MSRVEWRPRRGRCSICGRRGPIWFHHCVLAQHVRNEGGNVWDFRNALMIGQPFLCKCHERHHHPAIKRILIPFEVLPESALEFAEELFGSAEKAAEYFRRYYGRSAA